MITSFLTAACRVVALINAFFLFNFTANGQQAGDLDVSFNPTDIGQHLGDGTYGTVYTSVLQPDGKLIIGGGISSYNGTSRNLVARIKTDGRLDGTFNPAIGWTNVDVVRT